MVSDPGLLVVSYRSLKSAPVSFFRWEYQVLPDNGAAVPFLSLLPAISRTWEATQITEKARGSGYGQGSNPGSALLSLCDLNKVIATAQLTHLES